MKKRRILPLIMAVIMSAACFMGCDKKGEMRDMTTAEIVNDLASIWATPLNPAECHSAPYRHTKQAGEVRRSLRK